MAELTIERLRELTTSGAREEPVVGELRGLNEKQRKALLPAISPRIPLGFSDPHVERSDTALTVAVFGLLSTPAAITRALRHAGYHASVSHVADVLADRAPSWLPQLPAALLKNSQGHWFPAARLIRELVRRGLVVSPDDERYVLSAIHALDDLWSTPATPAAALAADSGIVDDVVWRWFAIEGAGSSLHGWDRFRAHVQKLRSNKAGEPLEVGAWAGALIAASDAGTVPRSRLLDETVTTLARDFKPKDLVWFADFHDALAPSDAELLERQSSYLRLLKVDYGRSVDTGLNAARRLLTGNSLDAPAFLDVASSTLLRKEKKHATATLKLLEALLKRPETRNRAVRETATALGHRDAGVQQAAWKLISAHLDAVDEETKAFVAEALGMASPSVAAQAARTIGAASEGGVLGEVGAPIDEAPVEPHALAAFPPLVREAEQFARLFAALLDRATPVGIEQLLEASTWFAGLPDDVREKWLRPILDNHAHVLTQDGAPTWLSQSGHIPVQAHFWLAALCDTILYGTPPPIAFSNDLSRQMPRFAVPVAGQTPHALLILRISELCAKIARGDLAPILSTPTHADGSIDEAVLHNRLAADEVSGSGGYDLLQAWLRVRKSPAERIASGVVRRTPDGYVSAVPEPDGQIRIAQGHGKELTESVRALAGTLTTRRARPASGAAISHGWGIWPGMWLWLLPGEPDLALAHWLPAFIREVEKSAGGTGIAPVLQWWRTSRVLDTPFALYCLTLAISSTRPESRIEAATLAIHGLTDGSVNTAMLADAFVDSFDHPLHRAKAERVADALATQVDVHPHALWHLLVSVLPGLTEIRPRGYANLLSVACDVAAAIRATGVPQAIIDLADEKGATKAHHEARRLVGIIQNR